MIRPIGFIFFISLIYNDLISQNNDLWYFSMPAVAVDFSNGGPISITYNGSPQFYTTECSAVIKDDNGNLLYYTQGDHVWGSNHQKLPNASDLFSHNSSTQGALFVPQPGKPGIIYLFTTAMQAGYATNPNVTPEHAGLCYSIIDRNLNSGIGDIPANEKNITLVDTTAEKLTAVRHANGRDIWIITVGWDNANLYAFQLGPDGLSAPVITNIGTAQTGGQYNSAGGQLKSNHAGDQVAHTFTYLGLMEILDFDNCTGIFSNVRTINLSSSPYGVEYAPGDQFLYITEYGTIYQFDASLSSQTNIVASKTNVGSTQSSNICGMQIGPDNKIYWAQKGQEYLGVINMPDNQGNGCGASPNAVYMGEILKAGLPNFFKGIVFVEDSVDFSFNTFCEGEEAVFEVMATNNDWQYSWQFSDGSTSSDKNPTMSFDAGNYDVTLSVSIPCTSMTKDSSFIVEPCNSAKDFFLPTAFSPNNDGVNDYLQLHGSSIDNISLNIYDRYGKKLYETDNTDFKWYGEKITNQVLIYVLDLTYTDGESIFKKGNITITK